MPKKESKLTNLSKAVKELINEEKIDNKYDVIFFSVLNESFKNLSDSRQQIKVKHLLSDCIGVIFFACLSGVDEWYEMEMFAIERIDYLKKFLSLENGIPSHDTLERVLSIIKSEELENMLIEVLKEIIVKACNDKDINKPVYENEKLDIVIKDIVSIDGKETSNTGNSNKEKIEDQRNLNELNVFSTEYGIVLSDSRIDEKTNEIPEAQKVLKKLQLKGCIVTADSLNTQKETARSIIEDAKGDYCLALKANQGNAYNEVKTYFDDSDIINNLKKQDYHYKEEIEVTSKKEIKRELYISDDIKWFYDKDLWCKLNCIGYEKKTIKDKKENSESIEERYYLLSTKCDVELFGLTIRRHWHVENLLHWVLDVVFKEDSLHTKEKEALHNKGIINRFVLSILKLLKEYYNLSYNYIRRKIGRNFEKEIPVIFRVLKKLYDNNLE